MRQRNRHRITLASALFPALLSAAQAPPFQANAQLGVPARVGSLSVVSGSNELMDFGTLREVTLHSAELRLRVSEPGGKRSGHCTEKLLILRASLCNPGKNSTIHIGPSAAIGLRLAQRYTGTGKFQFVMH